MSDRLPTPPRQQSFSSWGEELVKRVQFSLNRIVQSLPSKSEPADFWMTGFLPGQGSPPVGIAATAPLVVPFPILLKAGLKHYVSIETPDNGDILIRRKVTPASSAETIITVTLSTPDQLFYIGLTEDVFYPAGSLFWVENPDGLINVSVSLHARRQ